MPSLKNLLSLFIITNQGPLIEHGADFTISSVVDSYEFEIRQATLKHNKQQYVIVKTFSKL